MHESTTQGPREHAAPPRLVGRYVLQRQVGAAREQRRFLAFDMRLRRWCCILVPKARYLDDPRRLRRFARRAEGLAAVDHPRVLQVLDLDRDGQVPFVVTELARGGSLATWLRRNTRMPPRMAARVVCQVAEGLAAVHEAGGVHGTLEPKRVWIRADATVALTDLGVTDSSDDVAFRAPEARHTPRRTHGPAADQYALGALLYVLLTGVAPEDLFYAEAYEGMLAAVPVALQPVVLKACAVEPGDRFDDVEAFRRALEARATRLPVDDPGPVLVGALPSLGDGPRPSVALDRGLREVRAALGTPEGTVVRVELEHTTLSDELSEDSIPSLPYVMPNPDRIDPGFRDPFEKLSEEDVPEYVAPEGVTAWKQQVVPERRRVVVQTEGTLEDQPEWTDPGPAPWVRRLGRAATSVGLMVAAAVVALGLVIGAAGGRVYLVQEGVDSAASALEVQLDLHQSLLASLVEQGADERALGEAWGAIGDRQSLEGRGLAGRKLVELATAEAARIGVEHEALDAWRAAAERFDEARARRDALRSGVLGHAPGWRPAPDEGSRGTGTLR